MGGVFFFFNSRRATPLTPQITFSENSSVMAHSNNNVQDVMCYEYRDGELRFQVVRSNGAIKKHLTEEQLIKIIESGDCGPSITLENLRKLNDKPLEKWLIDEVFGEMRKISWQGNKFVCKYSSWLVNAFCSHRRYWRRYFEFPWVEHGKSGRTLDEQGCTSQIVHARR